MTNLLETHQNFLLTPNWNNLVSLPPKVKHYLWHVL